MSESVANCQFSRLFRLKLSRIQVMYNAQWHGGLPGEQGETPYQTGCLCRGSRELLPGKRERSGRSVYKERPLRISRAGAPHIKSGRSSTSISEHLLLYGHMKDMLQRYEKVSTIQNKNTQFFIFIVKRKHLYCDLVHGVAHVPLAAQLVHELHDVERLVVRHLGRLQESVLQG